MRYVGALIPIDPTRPPPPIGTRPIGRAALHLLDDGICVVLGDRTGRGRLSGFAATPDGWRPIRDAPVMGVYDRFPAPRDPARHRALLAGLGDVPVGNPASLRALSRDKLACQHHLEARGIPMPPVEGRPEALDDALRRWGAAFAKPRYGALGAGVQYLTGGPVPREVVGPLGVLEPVVLQRAVAPPAGWAGVSTRTLVQRDATGTWIPAAVVVRRSPTDPVVNVARGAEAAPGIDVLPPDRVAAVEGLAVAAATALADHPDGGLLLEVGVDAVIDADGVPWVIEVNTRPWGRLKALAAREPARFDTLHVAACARPFRFLAAGLPEAAVGERPLAP